VIHSEWEDGSCQHLCHEARHARFLRYIEEGLSGGAAALHLKLSAATGTPVGVCYSSNWAGARRAAGSPER
jgi:hypothetical protein